MTEGAGLALCTLAALGGAFVVSGLAGVVCVALGAGLGLWWGEWYVWRP